MRFQKQLHKHNPEAGEYGDCHRTCIAILLDVDARAVPNFGIHYGDSELGLFQQECNKWLQSQGLMEVMTPFTGSLEAVLECRRLQAQGVPFILGGSSRNGTGHSVLCMDGAIIWDPAQDDSGIAGPMSDGFYWVSYIVPVKLSGWLCRYGGHVPISSDTGATYCEVCEKRIGVHINGSN